MLRDRIEAKWIECFAQIFELCRVRPGDAVAILSETQSRVLNVELAELALLRLSARVFHIVLPTPRQEAPVPVRSTGASNAIGGLAPVLGALGAASFVVDLTVEGLLHAKETPEILRQGTRVLFISNEHPDVLERLMPDPALKPKIERGIALMRGAKEMRVVSAAGTDLRVDLAEARIGGGWGVAETPGKMDYWPGGLVAAFPRGGAVNGTLVMDRGDVNLTFKRYLESPIALTVEADFVTRIDGDGVDAELMRSYFAVWDDRNAYATSHVGWGMNPKARWDALTMYDRRDVNGTEQRAFAGNFLFSTGANEYANRHTLGHFDLPIRNCTVTLDGRTIVEKGKLQGELA